MDEKSRSSRLSSDQALPPDALAPQGLHYFHWLIIVASLLLSIVIWQYSKQTLDSQVEARFNREAVHTIELIEERMRNYEDALLSGVSMIKTLGGDVSFVEWERFATSINIDKKYPGINGFGVIHALTPETLPDYLSRQRLARPNYGIHPNHENDAYYPISYVIPVAGNEKAVGLDLAHETNRYSAATKSRDTGRTQITGAITLVQDNEKTPGFLFYAPFYRMDGLTSVNDRREMFTGMVYAPFVVKKFMEGTLEKEKRHVGIRLTDGAAVLYDEHLESEPDFDPDPLFKRVIEADLYGRQWEFDIWSTKEFRDASTSTQPLMILIAGIIIDLLLVYLFFSVSRASRRTLQFAEETSRQLELNQEMTRRLGVNARALKKSQKLTVERAKQLEQSNAELEQFACVASHDLQEPLRKVATFCGLLGQQYGDKLDDNGRIYIEYAIDGAKRMRALVEDLLSFARVGTTELMYENYSADDALERALEHLSDAINNSNAIITHDLLPMIRGSQIQLLRLLQNLIGNALKYRSDVRPEIHIGLITNPGGWTISVTDNGIGIEPKYHKQIFGIFKRLHGNSEYEGTGIGLAICQRIVERWQGEIWVDPDYHDGTRICFTIPVSESIEFKKKEPDFVETT